MFVGVLHSCNLKNPSLVSNRHPACTMTQSSGTQVSQHPTTTPPASNRGAPPSTESASTPHAAIHSLPSDTSSTLHSTFHIPHLAAIIQQLMENSLDAAATSLVIHTKSKGFDEILIRDDGTGIPKDSRTSLCRQSHTSKLNSTSWEQIQTEGFGYHYGFRGEALHCICNLAEKLVILTRTQDDTVGEELTFNSSGTLVYSRSKPCNVGTTVTVHKPFFPFPVRRKHLESKLSNQFKDAVELVKKYAFICENVRFQWINDSNSKAVFLKQKSRTGLKGSIAQMLGKSLTDELYEEIYLCGTNDDAPSLHGSPQTLSSPSSLHTAPKSVTQSPMASPLPNAKENSHLHIQNEDDEHLRETLQLKIHAFFLNEPPQSHPGKTYRNQYIFVNRRPVTHPSTQRKIREYYSKNGIPRDAFAFVHYMVQSDAVDSNAATDKMFVFLKSTDDIVEKLEALVHHAVVETKQKARRAIRQQQAPSSSTPRDFNSPHSSITPRDYNSPGGRFQTDSPVSLASSRDSSLQTPRHTDVSSLSSRGSRTVSSLSEVTPQRERNSSAFLTPSHSGEISSPRGTPTHPSSPHATNLFGERNRRHPANLSSSPLVSSHSSALSRTPIHAQKSRISHPTDEQSPRNPQQENNQFARFVNVQQTHVPLSERGPRKTVRYMNPVDENGLFIKKNASSNGSSADGESTDVPFQSASSLLRARQRNTMDNYLTPQNSSSGDIADSNNNHLPLDVDPKIQKDIEKWKRNDSRKRKREMVAQEQEILEMQASQKRSRSTGSERKLTIDDYMPRDEDIDVQVTERDIFWNFQRLEGYRTFNYLFHDMNSEETTPDIHQQHIIDEQIEIVGPLVLNDTNNIRKPVLLTLNYTPKQKYLLLMDCVNSQQKITFDQMLDTWKLDREIEEITPVALSSIEGLNRDSGELLECLTDEKYRNIVLWNGFNVSKLDQRQQSTQHKDEYYVIGKVPTTTIPRYTVEHDLVQVATKILFFKTKILSGLKLLAKRGECMSQQDGPPSEQVLIDHALRSMRPSAVRSSISQRTKVFAEQKMRNVNPVEAAKKILSELGNFQHEVSRVLKTKANLNKLDKHFYVLGGLKAEEDDPNEVCVVKSEDAGEE